MTIIIIDTFGGLCNQFYDINCTINFCLINNFNFSFRYCSYRNNDLKTWYNKNYEDLFDCSIFKKYKNYIEFNTLKLDENNTFNFSGKKSKQIFTNNYLNEIKQINHKYIVLKQFNVTYNFHKIIDNINPFILPSKRLIDIYRKIKDELLNINEEYNFIHYRYETDFISFFKIKIDSLENIISNVKTLFKNPELKIYIATSNIKNIINTNSNVYDKIISKNEDKLNNYNFEELAFIDYMFGLNSNEVYGHSKSSFSTMLNSLKSTNNYYDLK